ncbi:hypothetical protein [Acidisoma sp.]|uniref:hypothetical protein n=1 Tax=Acidisoma sp. TaxID=1872115 RepID=UPI003AFF661E
MSVPPPLRRHMALVLPKALRSMTPRLAALTLPLVLLAACAEAPQQSRSEQSSYDACHRQADQIVEHENVNALTETQADPISSPYSTTSILTNSTDNLSVEHEREDVMNDCLRHYDSSAPNTGSVTATPAAAVPEAPVAPPPPNLAGPTGSDLTKPPILPAGQ